MDFKISLKKRFIYIYTHTILYIWQTFLKMSPAGFVLSPTSIWKSTEYTIFFRDWWIHCWAFTYFTHYTHNPTCLYIACWTLIHDIYIYIYIFVAFIRNAKLSCRTLPTLLSSLSFKLGVGNLFLRDPWGVPSCLYRSFTPIYTTSIPLYLSLLLHSEVHVS